MGVRTPVKISSSDQYIKLNKTIRENLQCEVWEVAKKKHIWEIKKLGLFHPSKCQGSVECTTIITISSTKYV